MQDFSINILTYSLKEHIVIHSESLEEKHLDWFDSARAQSFGRHPRWNKVTHL